MLWKLRVAPPKRFPATLPCEKVSILNVWNYGPPPLPHQLPDRVRFADVLISGCRAGDILSVTFSYQVTSELPYYVELCERVVLTQSADSISGDMICDEIGENFNRDIHHKSRQRCGLVQIPSNGDWYVAAIVYAGGSSLSQPGDTINVNVGYAQLDVLRN